MTLLIACLIIYHSDMSALWYFVAPFIYLLDRAVTSRIVYLMIEREQSRIKSGVRGVVK